MKRLSDKEKATVAEIAKEAQKIKSDEKKYAALMLIRGIRYGEEFGCK